MDKRPKRQTFDLAALIAQAAKTGPDMTQVKASAEYQPPAAGMARARLVGYFELGKHEEENMQGKMVLRDKVDLVFELSGPNHEPRKLDDDMTLPLFDESHNRGSYAASPCWAASQFFSNVMGLT